MFLPINLIVIKYTEVDENLGAGNLLFFVWKSHCYKQTLFESDAYFIFHAHCDLFQTLHQNIPNTVKVKLDIIIYQQNFRPKEIFFWPHFSFRFNKFE